MIKKILPFSLFFVGIFVGIGLMVGVMMSGIPRYNLWSLWSDYRAYTTTGSLQIEDSAEYFQELYREISTHFYHTGDIDAEKMLHNAMWSFVNALWDPFSSYMPPEEAKEFDESISGNDSFEGIGAVLSQKDQGVMIEEVLKDSPAQQAWLMPLDLIIKVDGEIIQWLPIREVVNKIRGPKETTVELSIMRTNKDSAQDAVEFLTKEVVRDIIVIPTVSSKIIDYNNKKNIWYISLGIFAQDTDQRLVLALQEIMSWTQLDGLIIDLRGNGWGLLPEAVRIASRFLPKGVDVVQVKYRLYADATYKSEWWQLVSDVPLVILIDEYSASASEILALALRSYYCNAGWERFSEWCRLLIVWKSSFGKGSIQQLQYLQSGGSLKITVWNWYPIDGVSINMIGILPDIEVTFDRELYQAGDIDTQLDRALQLFIL